MSAPDTLAAALAHVGDAVHHVEIAPALFDVVRATAQPGSNQTLAAKLGMPVLLDDRMPPGAWLVVADDGTVTAHGLDLSTTAVLDKVQRLRALVSAFWSEEHPATVRHETEQLEQRLIGFAKLLGDWPTTATTAAPAPDGSLPTVDEAVGWRSDQWIVLLRTHQVSQKTVLAAVRADAEAAGLTPPAGLRDFEGDPLACRLLLDCIAQASHIMEGAPRG